MNYVLHYLVMLSEIIRIFQVWDISHIIVISSSLYKDVWENYPLDEYQEYEGRKNFVIITCKIRSGTKIMVQ